MTVKKPFKWPIVLLIGLSSCFLWLSNAYAGTTLSAGLYHVCGIKADSTLACWGNNNHERSTPPEGTFTQISAGYDFSCALRTDGRLACWGQDKTGETSPPPGNYKQVEAGGNHACALADNGAPICWGENSENQVAYPSGPFQQLALGDAHSCGLNADGTVECWGSNSHGQADTPADTTFSSITAGYQTTCGIKTDGIANCWGKTENSYGYLTQLDFAPAGSSAFLKQIQYEYIICGLKSDNTVSCPTLNSTPSGIFSYVVVGGHIEDIPNISTINNLVVYDELLSFACGIRENGLVACWGEEHSGRTIPPEDVVFKYEVIPTAPCSPAPCFTQADMDANYENGRQACITAPSSCDIAISQEPEIAAIIGTDLSLHVSKMEYQTLTGTSILWADLIFGGQNEQGELFWILDEYGEVE